MSTARHACTQRQCLQRDSAPNIGPSCRAKGANTPFILESRGLQRSETMSSLLERNPEIKDLMNQGELVPDTMVLTYRAPYTSCS